MKAKNKTGWVNKLILIIATVAFISCNATKANSVRYYKDSKGKEHCIIG